MRRLLTIWLIVSLLVTGIACSKSGKTPPSISNISASSIGEASATITWTTDEPATSQVEYGTTTAYGSTLPRILVPNCINNSNYIHVQ